MNHTADSTASPEKKRSCWDVDSLHQLFALDSPPPPPPPPPLTQISSEKQRQSLITCSPGSSLSVDLAPQSDGLVSEGFHPFTHGGGSRRFSGSRRFRCCSRREETSRAPLVSKVSDKMATQVSGGFGPPLCGDLTLEPDPVLRCFQTLQSRVVQ
ncbi:unnamed protein product [Pleuronectes platessa]|uniref:Uncharacterized protein n=1 Tax=Pleuronectes platessa TaxID=8262 RepID=A0A9N7TZW0_PLEPL|nr:unnamed protein product [Pleuronectes platessa]